MQCPHVAEGRRAKRQSRPNFPFYNSSVPPIRALRAPGGPTSYHEHNYNQLSAEILEETFRP